MCLLFEFTEGLFHQRLLPLVMPRHVAARGRGGRRPARIVELLVLAHVLAQIVAELVPRALVLRLLLAPHDFGVITTSGFLNGRSIWRLTRWKICAAVVGTQTCMLCSAHSCR